MYCAGDDIPNGTSKDPFVLCTYQERAMRRLAAGGWTFGEIYIPVRARDVHPIDAFSCPWTARSKFCGNVRPNVAGKVSTFPEGFATAFLRAWEHDVRHPKECYLRYKRVCEGSEENIEGEGGEGAGPHLK